MGGLQQSSASYAAGCIACLGGGSHPVLVALVRDTLCNSTATEAVPVLIGLHQHVKDLG